MQKLWLKQASQCSILHSEERARWGPSDSSPIPIVPLPRGQTLPPTFPRAGLWPGEECGEGGKARTGWGEEAKGATLQGCLGQSANPTANPTPARGTKVKPKGAAFRGEGRTASGISGDEREAATQSESN